MLINKSIDDLIKDFWENRAMGIIKDPLDLISKETLVFLRERYPYIQIINMQAKSEDSVAPKFRKSPAGWIIHDYGQAMSVSPGKYLHGSGNPELQNDKEGSDDGGTDSTGFGTLTRQVIDSTRTMVEMAIEKGWNGIEIISGTNFMKWAIWFASQDKNYPLIGYAPDRDEQKKLERVKRIQKERTQVVDAEEALARKMNE